MDRQDIDALLIGALYGELTPAEEARLAAHLDSHPTDRGALDDLKTARQAVRESRIFELQVDPPQHLSALLLQEAHRRAPKRVVQDPERESWFTRFMRSFAAHPAMAAAAMLVLVVGVAGSLYMRKGADFAKKEYAGETRQLEEAEVTAQTAPAPLGAAEQAEGRAAGSAAATPAEAAPNDQYQAGLYDRNSDGDSYRKRDEASNKKQDLKAAKEESASERWAEGKDDLAKAAPQRKKSGPSNGIVVGTAAPEPKDLDAAKDTGDVLGGAKGNTFSLDGADDSVARNTATRAGAGGGANAPGTGTATASTGSSSVSFGKTPPATNAPYAQPPPPPAAPSTDKSSIAQKPATPAPPKSEPKQAEKPSDAKVATKSTPEKAPAQEQQRREDSALLAWAKGEHDAVKALVRKGDCTAAAKRALGVSNRAPDYYAASMASDRDLKSCMAYINSERDKDAEKSGKARAQKRVNADETQAAPAPSK